MTAPRDAFRSATGAPRSGAEAWIAVCAVVAGLAAPTPAAASPWTLRQGEVVLGAAFEFQFADGEFLDERGAEQPFPLRGAYRGATFNLAARFGLTDAFELELQLPFRLVAYRSDPVILLEQPPGSTAAALDFYQENVLDFSQLQAGTADLSLAARYRLWLDRLGALAIQLRFATPTGYDPPSGTFGDRPTDQQDFVENVETFVRPENVTDDVTLGYGVVVLEPSVLLGLAFSSGTFLRLDAGYQFRFGGGGDQLVGAFKVGQLLGDRVLLFAEARATWAVTEGRVIGISVAAEDPELPATAYGGTTNLVLRELTLDRDAVDVGGGALFKLTPGLEAFVGGSRTVWGRNTAAIASVYAGLAWRTDLFDEARR